ncbi:DMT family transporter [Pseudodesulfovibrio sp.]|uniref:DMT family transporter n=1 Tax=Pseudodesulfovibrio sp. TaxID=2035812 RepID=UPI00262B1121|nr:DMT family transporter [Pseudodesulfovibrio sp.]MDD3311785.1 DMT family transporter [Pseudodesulfovibrio sp.]
MSTRTMHLSTLSSGYGFTVLAAFSWSLMTLFAKAMLAAGLSPMEISFWRAAIGGLCFIASAASLRTLRIPPARALLFILWGVLSVAGLFYVFLTSIQYNGAAMGEILLYTAPVWVAVFSRYISGENVSRRKWTAIAMALCGVAFVCFSGGSIRGGFSPVGILCGLASGLCYAMQYPFFKYWQKHHRTETIYAYMEIGGVLAMLPFVRFHTPYAPQTWSMVVLMAFFTGYLAFWAYGQGLRRLPQVHVAVLCNLEPILGTAWACWFFGENFTPAGWAGFSLILVAVLILATERARHAG